MIDSRLSNVDTDEGMNNLCIFLSPNQAQPQLKLNFGSRNGRFSIYWHESSLQISETSFIFLVLSHNLEERIRDTV